MVVERIDYYSDEEYQQALQAEAEQEAYWQAMREQRAIEEEKSEQHSEE